MTLAELEPGDKFIHANSKAKKPQQFVVKGSCLTKRGYGGFSRQCIDLTNQVTVGKSCKLEVVKIGESKHKQKYLERAQKQS